MSQRDRRLWGSLIAYVGFAIIVTKILTRAGMPNTVAFVTYGLAAAACIAHALVVHGRHVGG